MNIYIFYFINKAGTEKKIIIKKRSIIKLDSEYVKPFFNFV